MPLVLCGFPKMGVCDSMELHQGHEVLQNSNQVEEQAKVDSKRPELV